MDLKKTIQNKYFESNYEHEKALRKELEKELLQLRNELRISDKRYQQSLAIKASPNNIIKIKPIKSITGDSESVAFLICSDWHVEELVTLQSTNGMNDFNLQIADKRINRLFSKTPDLIDMWRSNTKIDTLVLGLLGDFLTGYIHEEYLENNQLSPIETTLWLLKRLRGGIQHLLDNGKFKQIIIPCCVGNHSRITQKRRIATEHKNSLEFMMYHVLSQYFEDDHRVKFLIPESYHTILEVFNYKVRFHHGTSVSYQGGVGGLSIPLNKYILRSNKTQSAYIDVIGHFHQTIAEKNFITNGSLIGYNSYAVHIAAPYEEPQQSLFFLEKRLGRTALIPIILK